MKIKKRNNLLKKSCLGLILLFYACASDSGVSSVFSLKKVKTENPGLNLSVIQYLPDQVKDCACLFASDKDKFLQKKYILASDFIVASFVSINGVLTKFIMMSYDNQNSKISTAVYKSNGYKMRVEIKQLKKDINKGVKSGKITITTDYGQSIVRYFYGECGCSSS